MANKLNPIVNYQTDLKNRVKVYFDAEFTGLHRNTTLVSIGAVSDSGAMFYAEFTDYDKSQVTPWIQENVIDKLLLREKPDEFKTDHDFWTDGITVTDKEASASTLHCNRYVNGPASMIGVEFVSWLGYESRRSKHPGQIQFYTDCYAYDWVLLNDLICPDGDALRLPDFINYIPIDLSSYLRQRNIDPDVSRGRFAGDCWGLTSFRNSLEVNLRYILGDDIKLGDLKHNCLWDAIICQLCFERLRTDLTLVPAELRSAIRESRTELQ